MSDSTINILKEISLTNNWFILLPEITLALIAFVLLGIDLFANNTNRSGRLLNARGWIIPISLIGQCLVLFLLTFFGNYFFNPNTVLFSGFPAMPYSKTMPYSITAELIPPSIRYFKLASSEKLFVR